MACTTPSNLERWHKRSVERISQTGRAELPLRPDFETTSAAMLFPHDCQQRRARWFEMGKAAALPYLFMKWFPRIGLLLLSLCLFKTSAPGAEPGSAPTPPSCILLTADGKVEVARGGTSDWTVAKTNQTLQLGDRLRTGLRSRATLRWSDLSVVRVNELTSLEIRPPEKTEGKPQLELKSGASYFFSREKPSEIQFRTPVASGAIRGTEFNLAVAEDGRTTLALLDGEVTLASAQGSEVLASGEQGVVEAGLAPKKAPLLEAINVIQWALYYPAVVDADELGLAADEAEALKDSLQAYRDGDLLQALKVYPENREPASDPDRVFHAALLLSVGQVGVAESELGRLQSSSPAANALRELMAAVKKQPFEGKAELHTASEWMARSYSLQSRGQLPEALEAARQATVKAPKFGAAWLRFAELEFGFGKTDEAAIDQGLALSPRNAQGQVLKGFVLAAKGRRSEALARFNQAIALDGALANAWLGRGLMKFYTGNDREGRKDLQVAATLEPQRAILRSYLGKAFTETGDPKHAEKELALAQKLDPNDPTAWLYSALLKQEKNRINEGIADLEKSKTLNDNRMLFRSRLLLDQDQAVRGANLASLYRDAGMFDFSVQEAARAVDSDYANSSAHLFLANSYDALRDPKLINLRYETPWFSELLVANLLQPVGGGSLSQNVSQQEYSRLFSGDHIGVFSSTEYFSRGDWVQNGSQYGNIGNTDYAIDASYRSENGFRPNNDLEQTDLAVRLKQQLTDEDSVFLEVSYFNDESGDVAQYFDQNSASRTLRVTEKQEPNLLAGYHREWSPGNHTLFLFARFDDTLTLDDSDPSLLFLRTFISPISGNTSISVQNPSLFSLGYQSDLTVYSGELQQIRQTAANTFIAGARYQVGTADTSSELDRQLTGVVTDQNVNSDLDRVSVYAYDHWQIIDSLRLTAGLSYDRLHFPQNIDTSPISTAESTTDKWSPKFGILWSPWKDTHLRAAYTRSLGGAFFDTSVRLEPVQINGFNQAFRSLLPESVAGLVPGTEFETWGVGLDQAFPKTGTYLTLQGQILKSDGTRTVGILTNADPNIPVPDSAGSTRQSLDFEEKSFSVAVNQLLSREFSIGARYQVTDADFDGHFAGFPASAQTALNQNVSATLHQVYLYANCYLPCGFFSQFNAVWSRQSNRGYSPAEPGDDFWQLNAYAGYRFYRRRAEVRLGVLNITDRNYRLNPLTLYNELPRERMLAASLKLDF
jgi:Flp pilus assembly protein TadD